MYSPLSGFHFSKKYRRISGTIIINKHLYTSITSLRISHLEYAKLRIIMVVTKLPFIGDIIENGEVGISKALPLLESND